MPQSWQNEQTEWGFRQVQISAIVTLMEAAWPQVTKETGDENDSDLSMVGNTAGYVIVYTTLQGGWIVKRAQ